MGFRKQAERKIRHLKRNAYPIMPLVHPEGEIQQDYSEDRYMFRHIFKRAFVSLFHRWLDELETDTLNKI
jgi:uracil-DNA glycosylase